MANNTTLSTGSGGDTIRDLDRSGVKTQIVGLDLGIGTGSESLMAGVMPCSDNSGSLTVDAPVGTPVFVRLSDGSSAISTLPVSAASLPLPSGAATAAKQPALGTAGSASADVLTVQGVTSMTPILATVTFASAQAVTQSGTWNITNISGTISLPTGAATSAKQPALGTAGSASADVITVQGVASMTPLLATITFASAQAVTQSGTWNVGTVTTVTTVSTLTTITNVVHVDDNSGSLTVDNGGTFAVQAAQSGTWNVTNVSGTITLPTGASTAAKQPALGTAGSASADVITIQGIASMTKLLVTPDANAAVNIAQMNGATVTMGNGVSGTGVQRVTIASDSTGLVALAAGSAVIGHVIVDSGTVTTVSTVTKVTASHAAVPSGSVGAGCYSVISSGASNQDSVQIQSGLSYLYGYALFNTTASARYVKLYDDSAPTSATTPKLRIYLPPTGGANVTLPVPMAFSSFLSIRITTGFADNDTGACSAGDVLANVFYSS